MANRKILAYGAIGVIAATVIIAAVLYTTLPAKATGTAFFGIADAAAEISSVSSVQVTVDSLRVQSQSGVSTTVSTTPRSYDLLELNATSTMELFAQAELEVGVYSQFELDVSNDGS